MYVTLLVYCNCQILRVIELYLELQKNNLVQKTCKSKNLYAIYILNRN